MSIRNHKGVPGYQDIPDENLEIPSAWDTKGRDPIENAALLYALHEYSMRPESRFEAITDRIQRVFKSAVQWAKADQARNALPVGVAFTYFMETNNFKYDEVLSYDQFSGAWKDALWWFYREGCKLC